MWPPRDPRTDLGQPPSSVPLPTVPTWELFQGRSLEMVVSVETIWSVPHRSGTLQHEGHSDADLVYATPILIPISLVLFCRPGTLWLVLHM